MKKLLLFLLPALAGVPGFAQELFVYSEPASNMPAHSISAKAAYYRGRPQSQRYVPELMFGFSRKFMLHAGTTFSNMHSPEMRWESVFLYGKYRFLSIDDVHRHFRMALFTDVSYSRNEYHFDEVSLQGDRSGVQLGLIATQLINRTAFSATVSHTQAFDETRKNIESSRTRSYQSINYSVSAGHLVLPREYTDYRQLNMNIYLELIGQRTLDQPTYYADLAPSLQFIFNSNSKLNVGYRFQLGGNQFRGMTRGFQLSLEHTFFNALKRR